MTLSAVFPAEYYDEKKNFVLWTHKLNDYNEIYSLNKYLDGANGKELDKMSKYSNNIRSKLQSLKQSYFGFDYGIHNVDMRINIAILTTFVVCLCLTTVASKIMGTNVTVIVTMTILSVYLLFLILYLKSQSRRDRTNWSAWNFPQATTH